MLEVTLMFETTWRVEVEEAPGLWIPLRDRHPARLSAQHQMRRLLNAWVTEGLPRRRVRVVRYQEEKRVPGVSAGLLMFSQETTENLDDVPRDVEFKCLMRDGQFSPESDLPFWWWRVFALSVVIALSGLFGLWMIGG